MTVLPRIMISPMVCPFRATSCMLFGSFTLAASSVKLCTPWRAMRADRWFSAKVGQSSCGRQTVAGP